MYTYLTGHFPFTTNWGMQYILILYSYDSNAILLDPIKSINDTDILRSYDSLYDTSETAGHAIKFKHHEQ